MPDKITLTQTELDTKIATAKEGLLTQEQVDSAVKERLVREGKKFVDYDDLKKFKTDHEKLADETAQKDLESRKEYDKAKEGWVTKETELQGIITTKDSEISSMRIGNALTSEIVKQNAYVEETKAILRGQVVIGENKDIRIKGRDANGQEITLTIEEGVKKFLEQRPHLIKATKRDGGGTGAGQTDTQGNTENDLNALNTELMEAQRVGDHKKVADLRTKVRASLTSQGIRR